MSIQTKKRFKNLGKIMGIALFALLIFTNIKVALMDESEIASGDISLFGVEVSLFVPSYAETTGTGDNKLKAKVCKRRDGSLGSKTTCDNPSGSYCLPGQGSGICS